jgi:aminopeptidase N
MYDAHTYQKAAMVLHQLRFELGENIWWQGVRQYARENAFRNVVIEDLQRAMEQTSGRSLAGFFNQWFRRPGHPELEIEHHYEPQRALYEIHVAQVQDSIRLGTFSFEVDIEVNMDGAEPWVQRYRISTRDTTFRFAIPGGVNFVRFDAGDWVLADIHETKEVYEWSNQVRYDDEMAGRYDAVVALGNLEPQDEIRDVLIDVLQSDLDPFVRKAAAEYLIPYAGQPDVRVYLGNTVRSDQDAGVRRAALDVLGSLQDEMLLSALRAALQDPSYLVAARGVELFATYYNGEAVSEFRSLYSATSWDNTIERALVSAYGTLAAIEGIPYLQDHLADSFDREIQANSLQSLARIAGAHAEVRANIVQSILGALDSVKEPVRYAAVQALQPLRDAEIATEMSRRMASEPSNRIRQLMTTLAGPANQ